MPACAAKAAPWRASLLTLYPEHFPGILDASILGRARADEIWSLETIDIRAFSGNRRGSVDDTPAGGGPGMVMRADVAARAVASVRSQAAAKDGISGEDGCAPDPRPVVYPSPRGAVLTQQKVREWAAGPGLVVFCGRFEGLDERAIAHLGLEEISLGDFVLAGGEAAAIAMIEACVRLLPGAAGNEASLADESFETGLLEYPHYTRPRVWENMAIPAPLLSGDHARIAAWRIDAAKELTRLRRPDLWASYCAANEPAAAPAARGRKQTAAPPVRRARADAAQAVDEVAVDEVAVDEVKARKDAPARADPAGRSEDDESDPNPGS